jgi:nucleoside diphosphate kinase
MKTELTYALITPYTILKSRTGGVISRLLSRTDLEFCGAQIFAPSAELAEEYAKSMAIQPQQGPAGKLIQKLLSEHIQKTFSPSDGRRHRVMMLLFRGEDAISKVTEVVGNVHPEHRAIDSLTGESVRDTYADLIVSPDNADDAIYFEPAVLTPQTKTFADKHMRIFADFMVEEPNLVENVLYPDPAKIERTLVIIKPDNWRFPSSKPGTIIDMFSRTGLRIIGCKVAQMSVAQALEFYGPVESALMKKLAPVAGKKAKVYLEERFDMPLNESVEKCLTDAVGTEFAKNEFYKIIEFMSGYRPSECPPDQLREPGRVKSMVLVYEGENAVEKIRTVLGPTDPTQAPGGTIRKEFGSDVMVNTAHASDSPENAKREMRIVDIQNNPLASLILDYLN